MVVRDTKWEMAVSDSGNVLQERNGVWLLPAVPAGVIPEKSITRHIRPDEAAYRDFLGRVDQAVVHDSAAVCREFYRYTKCGVELLGYESIDSTRLFTIYDPPLLVLPADLEESDSVFLSQSVPRFWNAAADSFSSGQKTKIRVKLIKRGSVQLDTAAKPALLLAMTMSMDGIVGFAGTDLIVPDAIVMRSTILFAEGLGPVLEWGIRSREKAEGETDAHEIEPGMENRERFQERETYIEVSLHHKMDG